VKTKNYSRFTNLFICAILTLLAALVLSACTPGGNQSPDEPGNQSNTNNGSSSGAPTNPAGSPTNSAGATNIPAVATMDVDAIPAAWEISAHANTYVVNGAGENSACTQCHAPANYIPPVDEIPQSCFICKFEVTDPPPLTSQDIWENIQCNICHEPDRKGNITAEYSWLEVPILEQYAEVNSSSELCLMCHKQVDIPGHKPQVDLANAHADMVCTDCHNAHDLQASCSTTGCHDDVIGSGNSIEGHDDDHQNVSCNACHQSGGLPFGMAEVDGQWVPLVENKAVDGSSQLVPYDSHDIVKESDCKTCHFSGNPWGLKVVTEK
jgi:hypothetical protein